MENSSMQKMWLHSGACLSNKWNRLKKGEKLFQKIGVDKGRKGNNLSKIETSGKKTFLEPEKD
jgi:hypothetical protein